MNVRRREFLHLLGASGGWLTGAQLLGCDSSSDPQPEPEPEACTDSWWLCDNFAPVEETDVSTLEVIGNLPPELVGVYARNGPNPSSGTSGHWFVGDGMVHAVRLEGGDAKWYRARYVQTELLENPPMEGVLAPPTLTSHQANTALLHHEDSLLCLSEVGIPYAVTRNDLTTVGPHDFGGQLEGSMTAHPKRDPVTGELVFFGYDILDPSCRYYVLDDTGTLTRQETITLREPVMMHDFQMTASHVVWMDLPILFDLDQAIGGNPLPFGWTPDNGARIGVMPRDGGDADVEWFDIDLCFIFHTFNAFNDPNDPNKVILDAIRYPEMWVTSSNDQFPESEWWRYTMTLGTGDVKAERMDERTIEFPKIDPRKQGLQNAVGYSLAATKGPRGDAGFDTLAKYDFATGKRTDHVLDGELIVGEPTFVPASANAAEDEGWLVAYAYDRSDKRSQLLVVDASDMAAEPVARVLLPARVPHGFHGIWSPDPA